MLFTEALIVIVKDWNYPNVDKMELAVKLWQLQ